MCRYAFGNYKDHYACFECHKMFRQPYQYDEVRVASCPQCGEPMRAMGRDFKAPKQSDHEQWRKVQELFRHGFRFNSCGCSGPGPRPVRLREVPVFLEENLPRSEGEELLRRITQAAAAPPTKQKRTPAGRTPGRHPLELEVEGMWSNPEVRATALVRLRERRRGRRTR